MITPCPGVLLRQTEKGIPVLRVHYSADSDHTPEWAASERAKYTSQSWWDLEMEILYDAKDGLLVYPEFDPAIHVIPDSQIPTRGCRFMSIDPHPRTPHAMLWVLIDQWSDWYVYRELWPSVFCGRPEAPKDDVQDKTYTIREYVEAIAALERNRIEWRLPATDDEYGIYRRNDGGENLIYRFMDQAGKGFMASGDGDAAESYTGRYSRFGIQCSDPIKSHKSGEDAIRDLLKVRNHDMRGPWPRLHIAQSCIELRMEFMKLRYPKTNSWNDERDLKQDPVKARSHMLDNLRYLATGRLSYIPNLVS